MAKLPKPNPAGQAFLSLDGDALVVDQALVKFAATSEIDDSVRPPSGRPLLKCEINFHLQLAAFTYSLRK